MKRAWALLCAVLLLSLTGWADAIAPARLAQDYLEQGEAAKLPSMLPDAVSELAPEGKTGIGELLSAISPQILWSRIRTTAEAAVKAPGKACFTVLAMTLLSAMLETLARSGTSGGNSAVFQEICALAAALLLAEPMTALIREIAAVLQDFSYFAAGYIPVMAGILAAGGHPASGTAYQLILFGVCQAVLVLVRTVFVPMLCGYLALALVSAVCPGLGIQNLVSGVQSFVVWGLTILLTLFAAFLTMQAAVASGGDHLTTKATKFLISSFIPGIGGALGDLYTAAQGCIQLVRNTLGAFGAAAALVTFAPSAIRVLLWQIFLKLGLLAGEAAGEQWVCKMIKSLLSVLNILMAVLMFYFFLMLVSTTVVILLFRTV